LPLYFCSPWQSFVCFFWRRFSYRNYGFFARNLSKSDSEKKSFAEKYQILSGLYLAFFLLIHVSAVLSGRFVFGLDTNLYFGAAGLNIFPLYLFFVPYYLLSIISIFTHIACIHFRKTDSALGAKIIFIIGVFMAIAIVYGMTGLKIPPEYYTPYGM